MSRISDLNKFSGYFSPREKDAQAHEAAHLDADLKIRGFEGYADLSKKPKTETNAKDPSLMDRRAMMNKTLKAMAAAAVIALPEIPAMAQDKDSKPVPPKELKDVKPINEIEEKTKKIADEKEIRELLAENKRIKSGIKDDDVAKNSHIHEYLILRNIVSSEDLSKLPEALIKELSEIKPFKDEEADLAQGTRMLKIIKSNLRIAKDQLERLPEEYSRALDEADNAGKSDKEIKEIRHAFSSLQDSSKFTATYYKTFVEMLESAYGIYPRAKNLNEAAENFKKCIGKVDLSNERLIIGRRRVGGRPSQTEGLKIIITFFKIYMSKNGHELS